VKNAGAVSSELTAQDSRAAIFVEKPLLIKVVVTVFTHWLTPRNIQFGVKQNCPLIALQLS
jgi:hypothetical protein